MAPILSLAKDLYNGKDFDGNPVTIQSTIEKLLTPLPIQNFSDNMQNPNAANLLLLTILDGLGFSTNTYSAKEKTELQKLKDTISKNKSSGEEAFMPRYKEIQAMTPLQQKLARAKLSKKDSALYDAIHKVEATKDTKDLEATQGDKILNLYQEDKKNKNIDNYKKLSAAERKLYNKIKDEAESPFYSDKTTE